jgi:hypothetical protein
MLAFAHASEGAALVTDCNAGGANVTAYAVAGTGGALSVTIINKEESLDTQVSLSIPKDLDRAKVFRLAAPSLQATDGVTFGGTAVDSSGKWEPHVTEFLRRSQRTIEVPARSAAVVKWSQANSLAANPTGRRSTNE